MTVSLSAFTLGAYAEKAREYERLRELGTDSRGPPHSPTCQRVAKELCVRLYTLVWLTFVTNERAEAS